MESPFVCAGLFGFSSRTHAIIAQLDNKPHFARGIGDFFGDAWSAVKKFTGNVMDYIQDPESIVKIAIDKFTDVSGMLEPWTRIGKGMIDKTFDAILNKIKSVFSVLIPKVDYKAMLLV